MPGIMARQLYGAEMTRPDEAFPTLLKHLIPPGLRGFMFAAVAGAVVSSLASMLNSAATILTMDVYARLIDRRAPQKRLIWMGRFFTGAFVALGCRMAPADPGEIFVADGLLAAAAAEDERTERARGRDRVCEEVEHHATLCVDAVFHHR